MGQQRMPDRGDRFEWSGGHPALDLVNTLDERPSPAPIENLATYRDLTRFAELAGLIDRGIVRRLQKLDGRSGSHIVKRVRGLREHLHAVLVAANSGRPARQSDLDALSAAIQAAHAAQSLVASPAPGLASRRWSSQVSEIPLHACSLAIERLLVSEERKRIRKCEASDCDVYYLDTSKGQRRQWCSMKGCGNREKQRRRRATGE
jgi:predicted RNA-binding Zn ribbon-like protein